MNRFCVFICILVFLSVLSYSICEDINQTYLRVENSRRLQTTTRPPTRRPTRSPTKRPISSPTRAPTRLPSRSPTRVPLSVPTRNPTRGPTTRPTRSPTNAPVPTQRPTYKPSAVRTGRPSRNPTVFPTAVETVSPTSAPTDITSLFTTVANLCCSKNQLGLSLNQALRACVGLQTAYPTPYPYCAGIAVTTLDAENFIYNICPYQTPLSTSFTTENCVSTTAYVANWFVASTGLYSQ